MLEALKKNVVAAPLLGLRLVLGSKDIGEVKRSVSPAPKCVASVHAKSGVYQDPAYEIYELPDGALVAIGQKGDYTLDYTNTSYFPKDHPVLVKARKESKEDFASLDVSEIDFKFGPPARATDVSWLKEKIEAENRDVDARLTAAGYNCG